MANEPTTTITGNLTADPEIRFTQTGKPVASFTIANTPRFPDSSGQWQDGDTWFVPCSAWGDLAENVVNSLTKGTAVTATGRLRARPWEKNGEKRVTVELTVDDIGPSLRRSIAKVTKVPREHPAETAAPAPASNGAYAPSSAPAGDLPPF